MLERLFEFLSQFGKHLLPFVVVPVYQNMGFLRLGKYHRTRGPGLHWKWPFIEDPYHENIFLTTVRLQPQTLTTYPRKNWSSMILWNCGHPRNRILTREFVSEAGGRLLHRFSWLGDEDIGQIPLNWNHLVLEYPIDDEANLVHFTIGAPGFEYYKDCDYSAEWHGTLSQVNHMVGKVEPKRRMA